MDRVCDWFRGVLSASVGLGSVLGRFLWIWVLGRFLWIWVPSGSKTALSGVVNPELQFPFQKKLQKEQKKPKKLGQA